MGGAEPFGSPLPYYSVWWWPGCIRLVPVSRPPEAEDFSISWGCIRVVSVRGPPEQEDFLFPWGCIKQVSRGYPPSRKIFFFRGADQSKFQSGLPPKKEAFSISWGSVPWRAEKSVHKPMNVHLHCRGETESQCINLHCAAAVPFTYLFDSFAKRSASEKKLWYARLIDS